MMELSNVQSIYCYENTNILINKLDIINKDQLYNIESGLVGYKLGQLILGKYPFSVSLDEKHYLNLHRYLFEDIYPFAGKIRNEAINKSNDPFCSGKTAFCYPSFIGEQLHETLRLMKNEASKIDNREQLIDYLIKFYCDLNMIHPFREGNGRTLREFLREYVLALNKILKFGQFVIDYSKLSSNDVENLLKGTILESRLSSSQEGFCLLREVFVKIVVQCEKEKLKNRCYIR